MTTIEIIKDMPSVKSGVILDAQDSIARILVEKGYAKIIKTEKSAGLVVK